jgi:anaerobic magnesium-protoporphyrin IX monomethyl ester cyclase
MNTKSTVAIITGIPPFSLAQFGDQGISSVILPRLYSMLGKEKFHFSTPDIGPATVAGYLRQNAIETIIFDYYFDEIKIQDCDIVGISSTFAEPEEIKKVAVIVKSQNPSASIVLGGPLSWSVSPATLLESIPEIDFIVMKEGEETFLQLIRAVRMHQDVSSIEGLVYRDKESGNATFTAPRKHIDIEKSPYPAWDIMNVPSPRRLPVLFIETSRGCPYQCAYCTEVTYWNKPVRYRSSQRVVDEVRYCVEKYGINTFRFTDSCFSAPPRRCGELCDAIIEQCINESIPVKWSAYARIENLSPELIHKMKQAGCVALDVGLESGSRELLRKINKNYDPEIAVAVAKEAKESGLIINYNIIIGLPGETQGTLEKSMDLIERAAPDTYSCYIFMLLANSAIYEHQQDYGVQGDGLTWKHTTMDSDEAKTAQIKFTKEITSSVPLHGGEHFACYFSSLGYSNEKIRKCYQALGRIKRNPLDIPALLLIREAVKKIVPYS